MELEHLIRKEKKKKHCLRELIEPGSVLGYVICVFYKLNIGGFRMSAHFFSFYLAG